MNVERYTCAFTARSPPVSGGTMNKTSRTAFFFFSLGGNGGGGYFVLYSLSLPSLSNLVFIHSLPATFQIRAYTQ